jgi:methionyl-tRNA formyltransferase
MKTIVGFLSRKHGYSVLNELIKSSEYQILKIFTHKLNPKSQDPLRSVRTDFLDFENLCIKNKINIESIDSKSISIDCPQCDFIVEVSWRYVISKNITEKARIQAFGIHRGKLPDYAGANPIKQALQNNEKEIILSAHVLDEEIDAGGVIEEETHLVNFEQKKTLENNIQRLRDEITPLFPSLVFKTLKKFEIDN